MEKRDRFTGEALSRSGKEEYKCRAGRQEERKVGKKCIRTVAKQFRLPDLTGTFCCRRGKKSMSI
jgi:hypothetical protein